MQMGHHDNFVVLHHRPGLILLQKSHYTPIAIYFKPHYSLGALCTLSNAQLSPPLKKMNFKITALLRYNSYTIKFTPLKYTVQ